ncbi:holin [Streptomyces tremellae]|uniref:Uncharacterized protein n=1 Tax=Streptomyces tremellae TaxID=1124239 RepID=A0ABP7F0N1_9ACTN
MNKPFLLDLAERTAATYVETFAGLLLADTTHLLNLGDARAAAVAALPAAFSVIKAALAGSIGSAPTASALPAAKTPAPAGDTPATPSA